VAAYAEGAPGTVAGRPMPVGPVRRMLAVWKGVALPGSAVPIAIAIGHPPDARGSAIRDTPDLATIYLALAKDDVLKLAKERLDAAHLRDLLGKPPAGLLLRVDLGGGAGTVQTTPSLLTALRLAESGRRAFALGFRVGAASGELGLVTADLDSSGDAQFTPLATVDAAQVRPPFALGALAVQP
jgi:hypothetical protein